MVIRLGCIDSEKPPPSVRADATAASRVADGVTVSHGTAVPDSLSAAVECTHVGRLSA